MSTKAVNFKMEESELLDMKRVASVFNKSLTELIREGVREYVEKLKKDPFYRLTMNVEDASEEESAEILSEIEGLTDDDLVISSSRQFTS